MSMSTHCKGFRPPDEKWKKMKAIYDACEKADIGAPKEVYDFFNGEEPNEHGVEVNIPTKPYCAEMCDGVVIEVDKLPKGIKTIVFYNSY